MPSLRWVFHVFVVISIVKLQSLSCSSSFLFYQQQLDRVWKLPGQNFNVSFAHYAGYINVNQEFGRELFYWFFEAEDDPSSKPLALWLNGGPGYSSIALGLAEEIGPLHIEKDGKTLYFNPYSWNKVANILFLDSPVGVGFSYSNTPSDIVSNGDKRTAADNLIFIENWLERFPQYKGREFYLIGESYAGHYIPQLTHAIVKHNEKHGVETINLKGFLVGNAVTDDFHDHFGAYQLMWSVGMISDQTYKQLNVKCVYESFVHNSEECEKVLMIADQEVGDMDTFSIYTPLCPATFSRLSDLRGSKTKAGLLRRPYDPCTENHSVQYFNLPEVQDALHVRGQKSPWETNSELVHENWQDSSKSVLDVYAELLNSGLRIWMFSGNTDATIPVTSTRYNIDAMKLRTIRPWRAWYEDGQVGGWTEEYEGLTFVVVRGAGHEVPLLKPKQALTLFTSFLSGKSMPEMELVSDM